MKIKIEITEPMDAMLARLVRTGLFGISKEEAASRFLAERLRQILFEERKAGLHKP